MVENLGRSLRPEETLQKVLLSTTSHLVGEYESEDLLLTHAWPGFNDRSRLTEGAASRSAFVLAFTTEPIEKRAGVMIPDYKPVGDVVASYLSVLFGKRFDNHGLTEGTGFFHIPDLTHFGSFCAPNLPHNSHAARADYPIPMNLSEFKRLAPLLSGETLPSGFVQTFVSSAKFYLQALQNSEREPEIAYLHLITAGEILSNFREYSKDELLDEQTKTLIAEVQEYLPNGIAAGNQIIAKLLLIKRRFVKTITHWVNPEFFARTESKEQYEQFSEELFEKAIGAAYDLRSKYVHTGIPFGEWVLRGSGQNSETIGGKPVVDDKEFGRILSRVPTLVGLERVVRYCLLRFAEASGGYVDTVV